MRCYRTQKGSGGDGGGGEKGGDGSEFIFLLKKIGFSP